MGQVDIVCLSFSLQKEQKILHVVSDVLYISSIQYENQMVSDNLYIFSYNVPIIEVPKKELIILPATINRLLYSDNLIAFK